MAKVPAYKAFLAGTGLATGYGGGLVYGTVKDFVMDKAAEGIASGDIYKALVEAAKYGYSIAPETAIVGAFVSLAVGLTFKDWFIEGYEYLFGKKGKDVDIK